MKKHKIGEFAKILGLSNDTLRYYESRGISSPKRDEASGYRYYDVWDLNYLLDVMRYRSYEFPMSDVEKIIKDDDLESLEKRCAERELSILSEISRQKAILRQLAAYRESLSGLDEKLGKIVKVQGPDLIWQCMRVDEELSSEENLEYARNFVRSMPFAVPTFVLPFTHPNPEYFDSCSWGFSVSPEDLEVLTLKNPEFAGRSQFLPSEESLYTCFTAGDEGTLLPAINENVIRPIREMGYTITKPPVGTILTRVHKGGEMVRYFEIWVPVKKNKK